MPPIHLLTDQQISFFETFGYLGFPGLGRTTAPPAPALPSSST